tara:strand:- start:52 stop:255 length:204 start_codon:yes stop_codon:yes gene_type:complete
MGATKRYYFDVAEEHIEDYLNYLRQGIITAQETLESLLSDTIVTSFFDEIDLEKIISFELRQGETVQ